MRVYGLIGYPLTHSFSKQYFTGKFEREGVKDCRYELFPISSVEQLPALIAANPGLCGLNVTIPYKEQVLSYVHWQDDVVKQVKAANCIRIDEGQLRAYNTDVTGFEESLLQGYTMHHKKALILGSGGASKAVEYVLRKLGIELLFVSRGPGPGMLSYGEVSADLLRDFTLVVNTTPLGMYPAVDEAPELPYHAVTPSHYFFDLVYNPGITLFLRYAQEQGATVRNGADMLSIQAEESWRIWNRAAT